MAVDFLLLACQVQMERSILLQGDILPVNPHVGRSVPSHQICIVGGTIADLARLTHDTSATHIDDSIIDRLFGCHCAVILSQNRLEIRRQRMSTTLQEVCISEV